MICSNPAPVSDTNIALTFLTPLFCAMQNLWQDFEALESAQKVRHTNEVLVLAKPTLSSGDFRQVVRLKSFSKFENTAEALAAASALVDSKLSKGGAT